jgi:hypothetical protein
LRCNPGSTIVFSQTPPNRYEVAVEGKFVALTAGMLSDLVDLASAHGDKERHEQWLTITVAL